MTSSSRLHGLELSTWIGIIEIKQKKIIIKPRNRKQNVTDKKKVGKDDRFVSYVSCGQFHKIR